MSFEGAIISAYDRGGSTSPPFPDLKLRHGEPLDVPEFPLVYRS